MKKLEAVYLANVILYLPSIETIIKLIQVNKKCQDASKIIRYYNRKKLYENDGWGNRVVIKNVFDLFPNIETVNCQISFIQNILELIKKVSQIELSGFVPYKIELQQEIKDKIIKMDIVNESLRYIQLNQFPNLKKVKVDLIIEGYLKEFLGDSKIKLNQLIIQTIDNEELDCLKEFKNIDNIIFKIKDKITKERYLQLKTFAYVYSQYPIDGIDFECSFGIFESFINLANGCDVNKMYDLTLFTKCLVENDCDLRNCKLLEEVRAAHTNTDKKTVQIEGLKHLKRIEFVGNVDCIPSSVTHLSFNPAIFNYSELLKKDNACFNNIKEVIFDFYWNTIEDSNICMNCMNCTRIEFKNKGNCKQAFKFPINLKELSFGYCNNEFQLNEIQKITGLKKLLINFSESYRSKNEIQQIQNMFENLKELECLNIDCIDGVRLPSTITFLEIRPEEFDIDLSQYTNLKDVYINSNSPNYDIEVILPKKLRKLYVFGNLYVKNSSEIEIEEICSSRYDIYL